MKHVWSAVTFSAGFSIASGLINQHSPGRMLLQFLVGIPVIAVVTWGWERVARRYRGRAHPSSRGHQEGHNAGNRPPHDHSGTGGEHD